MAGAPNTGDLNREQYDAVEHSQGPMLVLAGAGSGKTRVITRRIARLLERGINPRSILAVSFTNKAAAEMRERMAKLVGEKASEELWLSTFHSFGVRFLREENEALGYDGKFVIFDQGDVLGLLREILRQGHDRSLDIGAILSRISLWKNAFLAPEDVKHSDFEYDAIAREVYPVYEDQLRSMHAVDFDDLVVLPVRILRDREDIRKKWQQRFRHLLVDEFQDTNRSQLELVRRLANELNNVCVVGDDDQSIYGWRGADVGNILDFERYFPGAKVVKLETNYRSRKPILDVANAVIAQSRAKRHDKTLRSAKGPGPKVRMVALPDAAHEAKFLVSEIRALAKGTDASPDGQPIRFGNMAVLYRSNQQARILEEELRISGVPYKLFGGTQFFDRKEVKDAVAYLRVLVSPRDSLSLRRALVNPSRGIGQQTMARARAHASRTGVTFAAAMRQLDELDVPSRAKASAARFWDAVDKARAGLRADGSLVEITRTLLRETGYMGMIESDDSKHGERRKDNLSFLLRAIERYEKRSRAERVTLPQFLNSLTLRSEEEEESDPGNRVTLSSLHSSKGLEFDVVFLIGCVEGQLPHSRTTDPKVTEAAPTDVDEERRLFYVGVTRARELLYLTRPERRTMRGQVRPRVPSRFLEGFPDHAWESYSPHGARPLEAEEMADMASALLARLRE